MIQIPNPQSNRWVQTNSGEISGNVYSTKNINFNEEGYAKLNLRASALVYNTSNFTDVNSIDYFITTNTGYYVLTGDNSGRPWRIDLTGTQYDLTADTNGSGLGGGRFYDSVIWQARWYVSSSTSFVYHDGNTTWTTGLGSLSSSVNHVMCVHEGLNSLAVSDGSGVANTVKLYDTSHSLSTTLTIPKNFNIEWIKYLDNNLYIGTKNIYGGIAYMFVWNGSGTAAQKSYPINGEAIFSGENYGNSIAIITSKGQLLRFNGGGFDVLANFPVYYSDYNWARDASSSTITFLNRVHRRGMVSDGEKIYININGQMNENIFIPNQPSGLWIYDQNVGLYHQAGYSNNKVETRTVSGVNTGTDTFTTTSFTALTGTKVYYSATAVSGGLYNNRYYYLIRASSTTFKLAKTYDNAIAGTAIDITSAGTTEKIYYHDDTDFGTVGELSNYKVGAIAKISGLDTNLKSYGRMTGSKVLYGTQMNNGTSDIYTLQTLTPGKNIGYITTPKITSSQIKDTWQTIYPLYNNLFQSADKITVKYKTIDKFDYPIQLINGNTNLLATWTSTTSFTTIGDLSYVVAGDEVEIIGGSASGNITTVVSTSYSSGTWTVTIADAMSITVADTSSIIIDNWKKLLTVTGSMTETIQTQQLANSTLGVTSKWLRLKIIIEGVSEPKIERILIANDNAQKA